MSSPAARTSSLTPSAVGATDPELNAVESLFRGTPGRSGLRSYEPSLRPPEGTHDYSWLYRAEEPAVTPPGVRASGPELADNPSSFVASSGVAVLPAPLVSWSPGTLSPTRRWRSVALLTVALGCALLLPWAAASL